LENFGGLQFRSIYGRVVYGRVAPGDNCYIAACLKTQLPKVIKEMSKGI